EWKACSTLLSLRSAREEAVLTHTRRAWVNGYRAALELAVFFLAPRQYKISPIPMNPNVQATTLARKIGRLVGPSPEIPPNTIEPRVMKKAMEPEIQIPGFPPGTSTACALLLRSGR